MPIKDLDGVTSIVGEGIFVGAVVGGATGTITGDVASMVTCGNDMACVNREIVTNAVAGVAVGATLGGFGAAFGLSRLLSCAVGGTAGVLQGAAVDKFLGYDLWDVDEAKSAAFNFAAGCVVSAATVL